MWESDRLVFTWLKSVCGSVCDVVCLRLLLCGQFRILRHQHSLDPSPTLSTATCSTGSLRVHDVKSVVAQSFDARYQCGENVVAQHSGMHRKCLGLPQHVSVA